MVHRLENQSRKGRVDAIKPEYKSPEFSLCNFIRWLAQTELGWALLNAFGIHETPAAKADITVSIDNKKEVVLARRKNNR